MRITAKGQVTIPIEIRKKLGLHPESEVEFEIDGGGVRLRRVRQAGRGRGAGVVKRLQGSASVRMTTNEILALTRKP